MNDIKNITLHLYGRCGSLFYHGLYGDSSEAHVIPGVAITEVIRLFSNSPKKLDKHQVVDHFINNLYSPYLIKDCGLDNLGCDGKSLSELISADILSNRILDVMREFSVIDLMSAINLIHKGCFIHGQKNINFIQIHEIYPVLSSFAVDTIQPRSKAFLIRNPFDNVESVINWGLFRPHPHRNLLKTYNTLLGMATVCRAPEYLRKSIVIELEKFKVDYSYRNWVSKELGLVASERSSYFGFDYVGPPSNRTIVSKGFATQIMRDSAYVCEGLDINMISSLMYPISAYSGYAIMDFDLFIPSELLPFEKRFLSMMSNSEQSSALEASKRFRQVANNLIQNFDNGNSFNPHEFFLFS